MLEFRGILLIQLWKHSEFIGEGFGYNLVPTISTLYNGSLARGSEHRHLVDLKELGLNIWLAGFSIGNNLPRWDETITVKVSCVEEDSL